MYTVDKKLLHLTIVRLCQNVITSERASQEEQNGATFSSIAPSSEELNYRSAVKWGRVKVVTATSTNVCENISTPFLHTRPAESNQISLPPTTSMTAELTFGLVV